MNEANRDQPARTELADGAQEAAAGPLQALLAELRSHPFGYGVIAAFLILGPAYTAYSFPEAPLGVSVFGGLAFGVYASLCAVPDKFY